MTLAHHGLVVWGDDAEQAQPRLVQVVGPDRGVHRREPARPAACSERGPRCRRLPAGGAAPSGGARAAGRARRLSAPERVILHYDDADDVLATLAAERMPELVGARNGDAGAPAPRRPAAGLARPRPGGAGGGSSSPRCGAGWPPRARSTRHTTAATPRRASARSTTGPRWCWRRGSGSSRRSPTSGAR